MAKYKQEKVNIIARGYARMITNKRIPSDVIAVINAFFDEVISFHVMNSSSNEMISDCIYFTFTDECYFFVDNDKTLYVSGDNTFAQSGLNFSNLDSKILNSLTKHNYFEGSNIKYIDSKSLDGTHCFMYTKQNELFGFGNNNVGQLGLKGTKCIWKPKLIEFNFNGSIKQIKCGCSHSLFLTENGNVFGCGLNDYCQLGLKFERITGITVIANKGNISSINCGSFSSYMVNNDDILISFGNNYFGELGINQKHILKSGEQNVYGNPN